MKELVSIIVPVYNMENTLERCIESILQQKYAAIEIILIDDGSQDDSLSICKELADTSERVRCYHTENQGPGPARNLGITKATGSYLYFADSDDYLEPNAISLMVEACKREEADLVVFGYKRLNRDGATVSEKRYEEATRDGDAIRNDYSDYMLMTTKWAIQGAPWNKLFLKEIIDKHHVEYPPLSRHEDEGFISRYMCFVNKVVFISDVLYAYCVNEYQAMWNKYAADYIESVVRIYQIRKDTILQWNEGDLATRNMVNRMFVCDFIKALELSYSSKMKFERQAERVDWGREYIQKYHFNDIEKPGDLGRYTRAVCKLIEKNRIGLAFKLMFVSARHKGIR